MPVVFHSPVRDQVSGRATPLTAVVLGGKPTPVVLHYRRHGASRWYTVTMRQGAVRGTYTATIPGRAVTPDGVDYYIKAGSTGASYDPAAASSRTPVYHGIAVQLPNIPNAVAR
jgi:hypothetical protein